MSTPVGLVDATTYGAGTRSVPGINLKQYDARDLGFVGEELLELKKRPVGMSCPLRPTSRSLRANTRQVFDGNRSVRSFGLLHNMLADRVIRIGLKVGLFAGKFLQFSPGCPGSLALEVSPAMGMNAAVLFDGISAKSFSVAIRHKINDAQVKAQHIVRDLLRGLLHVARGEQVKGPLDQNQVTFALLGLKQAHVIVATDEIHLEAAKDRSHRDPARLDVPVQKIVIKGNRPMRLKRALAFLVQLVGIGNLGYAAHDERGIEVKSLAHFVVDEFVKLKLAPRFGFPCSPADPITCHITLFQRGQERGMLLRSCKQFDLGC